VRPMVRSDMPSLPLEWQGKLSNQRTAWEGSCRSLGAHGLGGVVGPGANSEDQRTHTISGTIGGAVRHFWRTTR